MGSFIQNQLLGMKWLQDLVGSLLRSLGLNISSPLGASLHFFIYDVLKISILLCTLIFLISLIQSYFPPERSRRILGKFKGVKGNLVAALLGTITPFCSCSSIPLFMGFTAAGLPFGITFSFLISSPMVDLASLVLLATIFGWRIAIIYVVLGLIIAMFGGVILTKLGREEEVADFIRQAKVPMIKEADMTVTDRLGFAKEQVMDTFQRVFLYILLGVGIGALIHNWVPKAWIMNTLGNQNPLSVILATIAGVPMYGDIFGTIPVAEALLSKGAMLGTVLSFMMAVTTLSLPSLIMLRKVISQRLLWIFIIICTLGIILAGLFFNFLAMVGVV